MRPILLLLCLATMFSIALSQPMPADPDLIDRLGTTKVASLQSANLSERGSWDDLHAPLRLDRAELRSRRVTGIGTCLFILWQWTDHPADVEAHPNEDYGELLLSTGTHPIGSMNDFYLEASFGQFQIDGDVVGWNTASSPYASYANPDGSQDHTTCRNMLRDAISELDLMLDFSLYDNDGPDGIPDSDDDDGLVDALFFIHAGPAEESSGDPTDIWSHAWSFGTPVQTNDGVAVSRYSVEPEETVAGDLVTLGVFCHEYGHVLGLPDLYDTDYSSSGIGEYGLMGGGGWCHREGDLRGSRPAQFCAWSKWQLGWVDPVSIGASQVGLMLPPAALNAAAYRVEFPGDPTGTKYYLLENRQNLGFDDALVRRQVVHGQELAHGLAIFQIDDEQMNNANDSHRLVDVVDASPWFHPDGSWHETLDGPADWDNWLNLSAHTRGDNGNLWPGFTTFSADSTEWQMPRDRDRFADDTAPSATDSACEPVGVAIENIVEAGLDIFFDVTVEEGSITYTPVSEPLVWDFETDAAGWEFCNTRAHLDDTQGDGCPGEGGVWFGQYGWDECDGVGYGNNWYEYIRVTAAVNRLAPVTVKMVHRYETEPGYDYCYVEVRPALQDAEWTVLEFLDGDRPYHESDWEIPAALLDEAPVHDGSLVLIQLRLSLVSDAIWSSEDGLYCADGWWIDHVEIEHDTALAVEDTPALVRGVELAPATPNPFNPSTVLAYHVPTGAQTVRLDVFDERGRRVRTLVDQHPGEGPQSVRWDGRDVAGRPVASGSYVARLEVDGQVLTRKLALLK